MDTKNIKIEDIIAYCEKHNETDWLVETVNKEYPCKIHPRIVNEEGKKVVDKKAEPTIVMRPITFVQLKKEFVEKFFPETIKGTVKKESFHELVRRKYGK